jgi:hypothetical protein
MKYLLKVNNEVVIVNTWIGDEDKELDKRSHNQEGDNPVNCMSISLSLFVLFMIHTLLFFEEQLGTILGGTLR